MVIIQFLGGLGNQMFEYALYYSFHKKGLNTKIDLSAFEKESTHNGYELERVFAVKGKYCSVIEKRCIKAISKVLHILFGHPYKEKTQDQYVYNAKVSSIRFGFLKGYWQTEKYFLGVENDIRKKFTFPALEDAQNIAIAEKIKSTNSVSLHIRRGDYLTDGRDFGLSLGYYQQAIKHINENGQEPVFFIFSDNIEWAKENIKNTPAFYIDWNKNENSYIDMQLMSLCKHNIIANSSFSWWGAWLNQNKNKIVITPEKWMPHTKSTIDLLNNSWIKMNNNF